VLPTIIKSWYPKVLKSRGTLYGNISHMARQTTFEERKSIESKAKAGWTSAEIASDLGFSISTVRKWRQRLQKGGARALS